MSIFNMLRNNGNSDNSITEIDINDYFELKKVDFIYIFLSALYQRIFNYCWSRTIVKNKKFNETILFDCFLKTAQTKGFISLMIDALIFGKQEILTYDPILNVIEIKNYDNNHEINKKVKNQIILDFTSNKKIYLLKQYASIYYDCLHSLAEKSKINGALILKLATLTDNISLDEKLSVKQQALSVQSGINNGNGAVIDSKSDIDLLNADCEPEQKQIENIKQEISSFFDGMPLNFLFGTSTAGIGASGENDTDSLERSIYSFFNTYWKPYFNGLFADNIDFKVENWRQIANARDIINIVETTEYLDEKNKKEIILNIFRSINVLK